MRLRQARRLRITVEKEGEACSISLPLSVVSVSLIKPREQLTSSPESRSSEARHWKTW